MYDTQTDSSVEDARCLTLSLSISLPSPTIEANPPYNGRDPCPAVDFYRLIKNKKEIQVPAQFIPGRTGAGLLILNGFTFYMKNHQAHGKKQWYCSSRDVHGCRADVITYKGVDGRDYISIFRGRHIHDPPRLRQCHDGRFIREKDFFSRQSLK